MTVKSQERADISGAPKKIVIGTRGSALALAQTNMVKAEIDNIGHGIEAEVKVIKTSGDWRPEQGEVRLEALAGGKAQFAKELEDALMRGEIDLAVHSMKDMETDFPPGLILPYMLPREDARDAFISDISRNIEGLPNGSVVGTVSVRRQAFLLHQRPDLKVVPFRGNVQTRLDKLHNGQVDATFLACAGLKRLNLFHECTKALAPAEMLPAVGQGAVGIQMRESDIDKMSFIGRFSCEKTYRCVECERGVLRALGGSCHTPVGVHATLDGDEVSLHVQVVAPDGSQMWEEKISASCPTVEDAIVLGESVGTRIKPVVPAEILQS